VSKEVVGNRCAIKEVCVGILKILVHVQWYACLWERVSVLEQADLAGRSPMLDGSKH
jgi:hypothetical protein